MAGAETGAANSRRFDSLNPTASFLLIGLVPFAVIIVGSVLTIRQFGLSGAVENAEHATDIVAESVLAPAVSPGLLNDEPTARDEFDRLVRDRVLSDAVLRVKLWDSSGRIIYSDESRLIGEIYALTEDEAGLFTAGSDAVVAEVTDSTKFENRFEQPFGKLLEVYRVIEANDGSPLLLELYYRYDAVTGENRAHWLALAMIVAGAMALLYLLLVPMSRGLTRRLRAAEADRIALLTCTLDASDAERRRIAGTLHDGIVQDLIGLSFELNTARDRLESAGQLAAAGLLGDGAATTRQAIRSLRSLMVDFYPPDLHVAGLGPAVADLIAEARSHGLAARAYVATDMALEPEIEELTYRVIQESIRNAIRHSDASLLQISIRCHDDEILIAMVADDGKGFDTESVSGADGSGHVGLRVMKDLVSAHSGSVDVDSAPGAGTRVRLEVAL